MQTSINKPAFIRRMQLFVANKGKMSHIFRIITTTSIQIKAGLSGGNSSCRMRDSFACRAGDALGFLSDMITRPFKLPQSNSRPEWVEMHREGEIPDGQSV
ncbi:MAG: hypothetical protein QF593_06750 [Nitrospinota bacterium]|jgi:hypothetical protein|nr:hypothetical protein [Nitrospinota bacterium]